MKSYSITDLDVNEANALLSVLGDLPTKTGLFNLFTKVRAQLEAQEAAYQKTDSGVTDVVPK